MIDDAYKSKNDLKHQHKVNAGSWSSVNVCPVVVVTALESVDPDPVADGNILADMPVLKKSLKALIGDLGKVKRLAAFGMW